MESPALDELSFGVEIEILLSPRSEDETDATFSTVMKGNGWDHDLSSRTGFMLARYNQSRIIRDALASALKKQGIRAKAKNSSKDMTAWDDWTLVDEALECVTNFWGIEFVSRVLTTGIYGWHQELYHLFSIVDENCKAVLTKGCATHVHVSPGLFKFKDTQLRSICKAAAVFDDAITAIMPVERKDNPWATSNFQGSGESINKRLQKAFSAVKTDKWISFFEYIDCNVYLHTAYDVMSSGGRAGRFVCWNFENVTKACGTVEFRRPPGTKDAMTTGHWVAFTLGFIAEAVATTDWNKRWGKLNCGGNVKELRGFVSAGIKRLSSYETNAALQRDGIKLIDGARTVFDADELEEIKWNKAAKVQREGEFVTKAGSRANTPETN
ncbi:putative amidoligase enzyme-domain-containing protein [Apodospora peruviana]|uniref:Amidoligase enzyme-domain-containing protein n=1 Tax=Apodospora peruviana TaxID=516989 RepID=A0AAE0M1E4_9PEZI|nr:putative amidoligase enzyme-domain-containing protein [Apodospora peruviana]